MKRMLTLLILCCIYACSTEMMSYNGKEGIYFAVQKASITGNNETDKWTYIDTTIVSFLTTAANDSMILIKVRTLGETKDYDRSFRLNIVDSLTTAVLGNDYFLFDDKKIIRAGECENYIGIKILRTEKLVEDYLSITINLEENEFFELPMLEWYPLGVGDYTISKKNLIRHTIIFNDAIPLIAPGGWWLGYFGKYSVGKMKLMLKVTGLSYDNFDDRSLTMNEGRARTVALLVDKFLKDMQASGTPVFDGVDVDGNPILMEMGSYEYKSRQND